jgi:hypothetical protein
MADNFDLQGWMREQKQGPYAGAKGAEKISFTSPKPKSKTGLNESLMGMIDLKPVGSLSEEYDETYEEGMEEGTSEEAMYDVYLVIDGKKQKYEGGPYTKKQLSAINTSIWSRYGEDLDAVQFEKLGSETMEEGMGDDDDMDDDDFAATTAEVWASPSGELDAIIEFNGKKARVVEKTGEDVDKFWKMIAMKAKKMGATHIHSEENDPETESIEDILSSYMDEDSDIPTNDQDYTTQPGYIHEEGGNIADKWDMIPGDEKEAMLDSVDDAEEGLADYAYMGWAMVPDEVKAKISNIVMSASVSTPEPDEDEKMAVMAMKQAKKGEKAIKGLNPQKDIYDLLYGDEEDDNF